MATTLALAMRASMSASGVVSGASDAAKALDSMGKQAARTANDVSLLKNIAIGAALLKGASVLTSTLKSAASSAKLFVSRINATAESLQDLANRIDISAEALQVFSMAATLSGVGDLAVALQKLAVSIGKAAESGDTKAFERLGLDFEALRLMSPEKQFKAVQRAIAALPTAAQRAAAAVAVFGNAGVELLPLMNQNLQEIEERMQRLGAVVSNEQVAAIDEMNDALAMVQAMFDGIIGQVLGNLAPIVTELADELMRVVEGFNGVNGQGGTGIANAITEALFAGAEYLAGVFDRSAGSFQSFAVTMENVASVFSFVGNVFSGVAQMFLAFTNFLTYTMQGIVMDLLFVVDKIPFMSKEIKQLIKEQRQANIEEIKESGEAMMSNLSGAAQSFQNAFSGQSGEPQQTGEATEFVRGLRDKFRAAQTPEAKAQREADKQKKDAERADAAKAAAEAAKAAAEADRVKKEAERLKKEGEKLREQMQTPEQRHAAEVEKYNKLRHAGVIDEMTWLRARRQADKKLREENERRLAPLKSVDAKIADKQADIDKINAEKAAALGGKSNEALRANDVRSGEGMAQFLALATGREDPAIEENRKTNAKLEEIRQELRALQQEKVEILGAAA